MKKLFFAICLAGLVSVGLAAPVAPYPHSSLIRELEWHWETYTNAAIGSDLWPVTWGSDDNLYTAWGDGGGFGGSDHDGRVAMGIARIEGSPGHWRGININGGKDAEHPSSFPKKGKTAGLIFVHGVLYAAVNLQDGVWPDVNHQIAWSTNNGATWSMADWLFPKGPNHFQPAVFLNFGRDYTGVPALLDGYVYTYGTRRGVSPNVKETRNSVNFAEKPRASSAERRPRTNPLPPLGEEREKTRSVSTDAHFEKADRIYLVRVPESKLTERSAYEYFSGPDKNGLAVWTSDSDSAQAVFADSAGVGIGSVVYAPALKRYLLTAFHSGPGQLGVFDSPNPWGPWTTIDYYENFGRMGADGEGLLCSFPQKWMSADGLTLWAVFSCYGGSARTGINAHDRFNLIKVSLRRYP